jgi:hypothetical protein
MYIIISEYVRSTAMPLIAYEGEGPISFTHDGSDIFLPSTRYPSSFFAHDGCACGVKEFRVSLVHTPGGGGVEQVEIEAEVFAGAPTMRKRVMEELVSILLSAAHSVIAEELTGTPCHSLIGSCHPHG